MRQRAHLGSRGRFFPAAAAPLSAGAAAMGAAAFPKLLALSPGPATSGGLLKAGVSLGIAAGEGERGERSARFCPARSRPVPSRHPARFGGQHQTGVAPPAAPPPPLLRGVRVAVKPSLPQGSGYPSLRAPPPPPGRPAAGKAGPVQAGPRPVHGGAVGAGLGRPDARRCRGPRLGPAARRSRRTGCPGPWSAP